MKLVNLTCFMLIIQLKRDVTNIVSLCNDCISYCNIPYVDCTFDPEIKSHDGNELIFIGMEQLNKRLAVMVRSKHRIDTYMFQTCRML